MNITVSPEKCQGFANCVMAAPDYFDLDDDSVVVLLRDRADAADEAEVAEAVRSCPVEALQLST